MVFAAIAAGGTGTRMGAELPKQFLELAGKPILIRTAEAFAETVDAVYIGVSPTWHKYTEELLRQYNLPVTVRVVDGADNRMATILKITEEIEAERTVSDDDIILTHDAVRPFINNRIVLENIEKCRAFGACGTFVPCIDTMGISADGKLLHSVPSRSTMYNIQTPQTAKFSVLKKAFEDNMCRLEAFTDLCGMLNSSGFAVAMAKGEYTNIKITTPADMTVARGIIGEREDANR